jgi:hypothetical protein
MYTFGSVCGRLRASVEISRRMVVAWKRCVEGGAIVGIKWIGGARRKDICGVGKGCGKWHIR